MPHVMFADSRHEPLNYKRAWSQTLSHGYGHVANAPPVVFHGQMLKMLLDGGDGDEARFQFGGLHPLPEFPASQFAQQDLGFTHCGLGFKASPFGAISFGSGKSSVIIFQVAPSSRIL